MMMRWMFAPLFAIGLGGCALDGSPAEPGGDAERNVGSVEQDIAGIGWTSLRSCSSLTPCKYLLGPAAFAQRCYISGIKGDLTLGSVAITTESPNVFLTVRNAPGRTLAAAATCISGVDVASEGAWSSAQGTAADLGKGTNRQCAISSITNINGLATAAENVRLFKDSADHWRLGGTVASGHGVSATATCWDNSTFAGGVGNYNFSTVKRLAYSPSRSGMGCAPTEFAGAFTNPSASANSYFDGNEQMWHLDVAFAGAAASCFF